MIHNMIIMITPITIIVIMINVTIFTYCIYSVCDWLG